MSEFGKSPLVASSVAYAASLVVKATAGILYGVYVYSSLGSAQWIQFHDAAALPANTAVPILSLTIKTIDNLYIDFGEKGLKFATGIVIGNSTTGPTLTTGAANTYFTARYV